MSVQFGRCNFDGKPVDPHDLDEVRPVLAPYGPDWEGYICNHNVAILHRAFHTTEESRREVQPRILPSGTVLTWDGRLDNREELLGLLSRETSPVSTDLEVVAAAYYRWGTDSFARLLGDWALSIWEPSTQSLLLAKDVIGTHHLFYLLERDQVTWCTILDPLMLFAHRPFKLEEEYIAGWLSFFPAPHLTPYVGIHSVPHSCFVHIAGGKQTVRKYWDFNSVKRIVHGSDADYEEHFRFAFGEAVRRRLRSDSPVVAELSGGMDSSAIVCMADSFFRRGDAETSRLDTISYFNDSEPNWNERPYIKIIEDHRGRAGCNIDVSSLDFFSSFPTIGELTPTPGSRNRTSQIGAQLAAFLSTQGNRVLLSGFGGDEVTGGVPTPMPELETLLASGYFKLLARQLKVWALSLRKPWWSLLLKTVQAFVSVKPAGQVHTAPWLKPDFVHRNRLALHGYENKLKLFGPPPGFQEDLSTLDSLRRQLGCECQSLCPLYETRYPFLDRDLLEFLYAIPREQLVRPGQRRSLMRRALSGIVPQEILDRRRKAFVRRSPMKSISANWSSLMHISQHMVTDSLGVVDARVFAETLRSARDGNEVPLVTLLRTLTIELWLRRLRDEGMLTQFGSSERARVVRCETEAVGLSHVF